MQYYITKLIFTYTFILAASAAFLGICDKAICRTIEHAESVLIHEAYVIPSSNTSFDYSVQSEPPNEIKEVIPCQIDMQAEWIPGYWEFDGISAFNWVSGVWRRPPPGRRWIQGFWVKTDNGWIRCKGFWSRLSSGTPHYISSKPPDCQLDQQTPPPPSSDYFWIPGGWVYLDDVEEYQWVAGQWEESDPHWIFVPASLLWRPQGYISIPAYWDWPLNDRGTAYSYQPMNTLSCEEILSYLCLNYPDYLCFLNQHWVLNHEFWRCNVYTPPWWAWDGWWSLSRSEHWFLWLWYIHPDIPHPKWITQELCSILPAPSLELVKKFDSIRKPSIWMNEIRNLSGEILKPAAPKLPFDPNAISHRVRKPLIDKDFPENIHSFNLSKIELPSKPKILSFRSRRDGEDQNKSYR